MHSKEARDRVISFVALYITTHTHTLQHNQSNNTTFLSNYL